jgi:hypothetical protein
VGPVPQCSIPKERAESFSDLAELVEPLLIVRRTLREQIGFLHRRLVAIVRSDEMPAERRNMLSNDLR